MPVRDALLIFCDELDISGVATTTTVFTDVVPVPATTDFKGNSGYDSPGIMGQLFWNVIVDGADLLAGTDGSIVTFKLFSDTDATPTTGGDVIDQFSVTCNTPTEHPDGYVLASRPLPIEAIKPYIGCTAYVADQTLSTGKVTSWIGSAITNK